MKNTKVVIGNNYIYSVNGEVSKRLSDAEVEVLKALVEAKGETLTRDNLMALGWPGKVVVSNSLNMAILALRRSLEPFGLDKCIITVPKIGFRLEKAHLFEIETMAILHRENIDDDSHGFDGTIPNHSSQETTVPEVGKNYLIPSRATKLATKVNVSLLFLILFIYSWIVLQHFLHKPKVKCEEMKNDVVLCAINIGD